MNTAAIMQNQARDALRRWWGRYRRAWSRSGLLPAIGGAGLGIAYLFLMSAFGPEAANRVGIESLVEGIMGAGDDLVAVVFMTAATAASLHVIVPWRPLDRAFAWLDAWLIKATVQMSSGALGIALVAGLHYAAAGRGYGGAVVLVTMLLVLMLATTTVLLALIRSFSSEPRGHWMAFAVLITVAIFAAWTLRQLLAS